RKSGFPGGTNFPFCPITLQHSPTFVHTLASPAAPYSRRATGKPSEEEDSTPRSASCSNDLISDRSPYKCTWPSRSFFRIKDTISSSYSLSMVLPTRCRLVFL